MGALGPGKRAISDLKQNPKAPCDEDARGFSSNYFNLLILLFHVILLGNIDKPKSPHSFKNIYRQC